MRLAHGYHVARTHNDRHPLVLGVGCNDTNGDECIPHRTVFAALGRFVEAANPVFSGKVSIRFQDTKGRGRRGFAASKDIDDALMAKFDDTRDFRRGHALELEAEDMDDFEARDTRVGFAGRRTLGAVFTAIFACLACRFHACIVARVKFFFVSSSKPLDIL
jgi:hypothetical protein